MSNEKIEVVRRKPRGIVLVVFLWILQSAGRLSFAALGKPEGMGQFLDTPISYTTSVIMFVMFLFLGIFGLVAALSFWKKQKWGFWSIILASIATIAFDIWGLTIQYTAALGFIVPAISIIYLYPKKSQLLTTMK